MTNKEILESKYLRIMKNAIEVCKKYKPKLGHGGREGFSLKKFQQLYKKDIFYSWFGLDSPSLYAAHKAAGGITSMYRQIGIGCEKLCREIFMDVFGLNETQVGWSYTVQRGNRKRTLKLDASLPLELIKLENQRSRIFSWIKASCLHLGVEVSLLKVFKGAVFEVRQGYKSKDSKRQNADIANISTAYSQAYFPVILLLSNQIDDDVANRYESAKCLILRGTLNGTSSESTYAFFRDVVGYDLAEFFSRNSNELKGIISDIVRTLLE